MIQFTCIECEHKYTKVTGVPEERMCNKCLREDAHPGMDSINPHIAAQIDSHCNDLPWK